MPPPGFEESVLTAVTNFSFFSYFLIFSLKEFSSVFTEGGVPPPVLGEVGGFSFFWISGRGLPPVGFGGRGDFVSRLGAGGGGEDRLSERTR